MVASVTHLSLLRTMEAAQKFASRVVPDALASPVNTVSQRVQVPNNELLWFWVIVTIVQVWGKYMIIRYLDPKGVAWDYMGSRSSGPLWEALEIRLM